RDPTKVSAYPSSLPIALSGHRAFIKIFEALGICCPDLLLALPALIRPGSENDGPFSGSEYFDDSFQIVPVQSIVMLLEQGHYLRNISIRILMGLLLSARSRERDLRTQNDDGQSGGQKSSFRNQSLEPAPSRDGYRTSSLAANQHR